MWNFNELKNLIYEKGFEVDNFTDSIQSVSRMIDIYEYHKNEAYSLIIKIEPKSAKVGLINVLNPTEEFHDQMLAIQAHTQSAMHNARALYDLISQLVNKVLFSKPIEIHNCDIKKILERMSNSELKNTMQCAINSDSYRYVNAFVNVIKHRNLVVLNQQVNFFENKAGILFRSFEYRKNTYSELWATDALQKSLDVKNEVIVIGKKLNEHLKK